MSKHLRPKPQTPNQNLVPMLLMTVGVLLLAAVVWLLAAQPVTTTGTAIEVNGRPSLKVDKEIVDFGDVPLGQTVAATFIVTNVGDQPLRFTEAPWTELVEGCWPPRPTIGAMVLNPGSSTELKLEFMMHGDMGGPHNFRIHLPTNDPTQPDAGVNVVSNWVP